MLEIVFVKNLKKTVFQFFFSTYFLFILKKTLNMIENIYLASIIMS